MLKAASSKREIAHMTPEGTPEMTPERTPEKTSGGMVANVVTDDPEKDTGSEFASAVEKEKRRVEEEISRLQKKIDELKKRLETLKKL